MELYKLIASIKNGTPSSFTLDFLPENFEGVKINQKFNFSIPMGYTPKFSVDTMRIVKGDKQKIDDVFKLNGLQSDVEIEIYKLNANGNGYDYNSTFAIDFQSYEMFDEYSEFALKAISVIDKYNEVKKVEQQYQLTQSGYINADSNFVNRVSLRQKTSLISATYNVPIQFEKNNDAQLFNGDSALDPDSTVIYKFGGATTISKAVSVNLLGKIYVELNDLDSIDLSLYINNTSYLLQQIFYVDGLYTGGIGGFYEIDLPGEVIIHPQNYGAGAKIVMIIKTTSIGNPPNPELRIGGTMKLDISKEIERRIIQPNEIVNYIHPNTVLNSTFSGDYTSDLSSNLAITSANSLLGVSDTASFKPSEFLSDICKFTGSMLNFKIDGSVAFVKMETYFNSLLQQIKAVEIQDFKDLSIKNVTEINFASVEVGQEHKDYDFNPYGQNWNKELVFSQADRKADENLDIKPVKFRNDFTGFANDIHKRAAHSGKNEKGLYLFDKDFPFRTSSTYEKIYDIFTPRDILTNWKKFLSFCFQNYGKNTLTLSSNGGTTDNLVIDGVAQFDDLVLNETPRLLPIEYNFTALIDNVDFSENILKINHKGEDVYLFVIEAETTDRLTEQTIRGLKIQF